MIGMEPLEVVRLTLLVIHFVGLAAIVGPFVLQMRQRTGFDLRPMRVGAIVQIVTGNGLIATRRLTDLPVVEAKMVVKMVIAVVVLAVIVVAMVRARRARSAVGTDAAARPWFLAAGVLAIADIVVAAVWI